MRRDRRLEQSFFSAFSRSTVKNRKNGDKYNTAGRRLAPGRRRKQWAETMGLTPARPARHNQKMPMSISLLATAYRFVTLRRPCAWCRPARLRPQRD